jgi:hypothetical protein
VKKSGIDVYIGNFGSGKTEIAINSALASAKSGKRTALVDLDIVNPYFKSTTQKEILQGAGVTLITTGYANTGTDIPSLPAEIARIFTGDFDSVAIDVGGDPAGARVLGRYRQEFERNRDHLRCHLVVNAMRPMTSSAGEIASMCAEIEAASRLCVDDLINNTNLAEATTPVVILEGLTIVKEAAEILGKRVCMTTADRNNVGQIAAAGKHIENLKCITIFLRPAWLSRN